MAQTRRTMTKDKGLTKFQIIRLKFYDSLGFNDITEKEIGRMFSWVVVIFTIITVSHALYLSII